MECSTRPTQNTVRSVREVRRHGSVVGMARPNRRETSVRPVKPPCECGSPDAYWTGDGSRVYLCLTCRSYNEALRRERRAWEEVGIAALHVARGKDPAITRGGAQRIVNEIVGLSDLLWSMRKVG